MEKPYYVYSHWVIGSDTPFYVGMSTKLKLGLIYQRAYRNCFNSTKVTIWKEYARQVPYIVKIEKEFSKKQEAIDLECALIKKWGRIDIGTGCLLNLTDGGLGVINASKETIAKRVNIRKEGKYKSRSLKESQIPYSIPIHKYNVMGQYIESYVSASEAARQNNTLTSDICEAFKGRRRVIAGFQWRTFKDINGIGLPEPIKYPYKKIHQIDFKTNSIIKTWESISHASIELNISRTGISNVLTGIAKTSGGFKWKYA